MKSEKKRKTTTVEKAKTEKAVGLFDHVKHIRSVQNLNYYDNLSEGDRKSFNHFMILRALSMDENVIESMAELYRYFDKIPSPQFYRLLIKIVPKSYQWTPWIKSRYLKHNKDLIALIANYFEVSHRQANEYINILIKTDSGLDELVKICKKHGLEDKEVEELINKENV